MAKNKTAPTTKTVASFIGAIADERKRDDAHQLIEIYKSLTGLEPTMWGPSIIGFGSYHYKYESGHEGDMPIACFSPRSTSLVIYLTGPFPKKEELLKKLGKHKGSTACVYVKKLEDIDLEVLKKLIVACMKSLRKQHPS